MIRNVTVEYFDDRNIDDFSLSLFAYPSSESDVKVMADEGN